MQGTAENGIAVIFTDGAHKLFTKGDNILRPNRRSSEVFYIESGFVEVYTINGNGDRTVHIVYGPGDMFPIAWAIDGKRRDPYCKALTETKVTVIERADFSQIIVADHEAARHYTWQILKQFGIYANHVTSLQLSRNRERLLCSLLYFGNRFGRRVQDTLIIEAPLTQDVIARSINMSRESVSRQISSLKEEGLVSTQKNGFFVICALSAAVAAVANYIDTSTLNFL